MDRVITGCSIHIYAWCVSVLFATVILLFKHTYNVMIYVVGEIEKTAPGFINQKLDYVSYA